MKKFTLPFWFVLAVMIIVTGCSDHSNPVGPANPPGQNGNQQTSDKRQFVWSAMNYWYYWQSDVPKLKDNHQYFDNAQAFQQYLSSFDSPKALFRDLQYAKRDRFSFFIPNYKRYNKQSQGIYAALGFNYGYVVLADDYTVIGYVEYIVPNSPADNIGLKRGTVFTKVDGMSLNVNNYQDALRDPTTHTLTLAKIENHTVVTLDSTVTIQSKRLVKDPVFYHTVIDTNNVKIGYLVYNAFHTNTHKELNKVFGTFKAKNIQTLILDLRYDGGGALVTARTLGSMISGLGPSSIFARLTFNNKRTTYNKTVHFINKVPIANSEGGFDYTSQGNFANTIPMNKLSIDHIYILISQNTASASEALINALKPFMQVTLIGTTTIGKDHGEFILYDAPVPYTNEDKADPETKFALSPMIFKITNKTHNHYRSGFKPDIKVNEINYLATNGSLPPLGSLKDPLVSKAISQITGQRPSRALMRANLAHPQFQGRLIGGSSYVHSHGHQMIALPEVLKRNRHK